MLTRAYLKEKGLEAEIIDAIMGEHGKSIQPLKDELATKQAEVDELIASKTALEKDLTRVEELEGQLTQSLETTKRTIVEASGAKDIDIVMMYLKDADTVDDFKEKLATMATEKQFLFKEADKPVAETPGAGKEQRYQVLDNKLTSGDSVGLTKESIMAIKDTAERQRKIAENLALFN